MSGELVSGPYSLRLLSKGTKKYMLVGDFHTPLSQGMCAEDKPLFPEYLESMFKKYPKKQWDLFIEQGINNYSDFLSSLNEKIPSKLDYDVDKMGMLSMTLNYFKARGCFTNTKSKCFFPNVRFHYIDIRQRKFGKSCYLSKSSEYESDLDPLGGTILTETIFQLKIKTEKSIEDVIDKYLTNLRETIKCFTESKLLKQLEKSTLKDELTDFFDEARELYLDILNYVDFCLTQYKTELIDTILRIQKKADITYDLIYFIINDFFEDKNEKACSLFKERINSNLYIKASFDLPPDEEVSTALPDFLANTHVLLMDIYALSRMTKSYARNNIIMAGQAHINVYSTFLLQNGFKTEWTSEQKSLKCAEVFEYEDEGFVSKAFRKIAQFFSMFSFNKTRSHKIPSKSSSQHLSKKKSRSRT
jgi:hypothetical protein